MPLNSRRTVLVSAGLVLLIAALYWPALRADFINYDDPDYVTENTIVQRGITGEGIKWAFGRLHGERTYWHPLTWMSHMLDCHLFGLSPQGHHAMNVVFHVFNSILLLLVLSNLTGGFWHSAAVAAMFAVHPFQVETVAWVTERKNLLSTLFLLLASLAYVRFVRGKRAGGPYLASLALFACGLMSKPAVVTLPFVFLLLDFWPLNRVPMAKPWRERIRPVGALLLEKVPFLALSAVSVVITLVAHKRIGMITETHPLPLFHRIQNAIVSYGEYLKKVFFPFDLALVYPHPGLWPIERVVVSGLILLLITVLVTGYLKKRPYLAVGWFWFLGVLVPTIGIVQVGYQAMADRFVYVPLIGVLIMIAWAAADLLNALRAEPRAIATVFAGALVYFGGASMSQLRHWKDSESVFRRALALTQRNYVANLNLALALFDKGKANESELYARRASEIDPREHMPLLLLGRIYEQRNELPAAISSYNRALTLTPDSTAVRYQFARALFAGREFPQAKEQFLRLTEVDQYKADAHAYLAQILTAERDTAAAVEHYQEALKVKPEWPVVLNNLAWLLATDPSPQLRNGAEAVRLAQRACELTRNEEPMSIGTLAAAYAEAGQFADAVTTAKRAQALAREKGLAELVKRNAELLQLYEAEKPVRDPP